MRKVHGPQADDTGPYILQPYHFRKIIFQSKKVHVHQDMLSPAELHDKCNPEELSSELDCGMLDAFLTCRPPQCGTGDRFRCDCNVYDHG